MSAHILVHILWGAPSQPISLPGADHMPPGGGEPRHLGIPVGEGWPSLLQVGMVLLNPAVSLLAVVFQLLDMKCDGA